MASKTKYFEDLQVWQKAMDFVEDVYRHTRSFPQDEKFGLTAQIRRAARSIPFNVAEGSAKRSTKEFLRFIDMAMGSVAEVQTQLILAKRLTYVSAEAYALLREKIDEVGRMLFGLERALQEKVA